MSTQRKKAKRSGGAGGSTNSEFLRTNGSADGDLTISTDDDVYDVHKYLNQFWNYQTDKIDKMTAVSNF
jgi:hypothetical protein